MQIGALAPLGRNDTRSHRASGRVGPTRRLVLERERDAELAEQAGCRVEVLFGARLLVHGLVMPAKSEVTLRHKRPQVELLRPSERLQKVRLALIEVWRLFRVKFAKQSECIGFVTSLTMLA